MYFAFTKKYIICFFYTFTDSLFMMNHVFSSSSSLLTTLFRFFTFASEYKIFVSSANNTNLRIFDTLHMSLMYKMNNIGPITEPCGTPHGTPSSLDDESHIFTNCFRSPKANI